MTRTRRLWVGGLSGAAAVALAVSGCGSSSSSKASPPATAGAASGGKAATPASASPAVVLSAAYGKALSASSAAVTLHGTVMASGTSVNLSGTGAFNWAQKDGNLAATTSVEGQQINVQVVYADGVVYEHIPQLASKLGGKSWIKLDLSGFTSGAGQNPAQILSVLAAQSSGVSDLGPATVNGVATTHYRATVDPSKAAANAGPDAQKLLSELGNGLQPFPIDVWIDAQGRPAQMSFKETITKAPANLPASAQSAFPVTTSLTMDLGKWGTPVSVTPPPADQVSTINVPGLSGGS